MMGKNLINAQINKTEYTLSFHTNDQSPYIQTDTGSTYFQTNCNNKLSTCLCIKVPNEQRIKVFQKLIIRFVYKF